MQAPHFFIIWKLAFPTAFLFYGGWKYEKIIVVSKKDF